MFEKIYKNQNWAVVTPFIGVFIAILVVINKGLLDPMFWILINIPLYFFHQSEEFYFSKGNNEYLNYIIYKLNKKNKSVSDKQLFILKVLFNWTILIVFGALSYYHVGFGLLLIIFSFVNSATHLIKWLKTGKRNPGLIVSCMQFATAIYAGVYITTYLENPLLWWISAIIFTAIMNIIVLYTVMGYETVEL